MRVGDGKGPQGTSEVGLAAHGGSVCGNVAGGTGSFPHACYVRIRSFKKFKNLKSLNIQFVRKKLFRLKA